MLLFSCEPYEQQLLTVESNEKVLLTGTLAIGEGPGETVLGRMLDNPYEWQNVRSAAQLLGENVKAIFPTHYYLKFIPGDGTEVAALEHYVDLKYGNELHH